MSYLLSSACKRIYLNCGNAVTGSVQLPSVCQLCCGTVYGQARWQTTKVKPEQFTKKMMEKMKRDVIRKKLVKEKAIIKKSHTSDILKRLQSLPMGMTVPEAASTHPPCFEKPVTTVQQDSSGFRLDDDAFESQNLGSSMFVMDVKDLTLFKTEHLDEEQPLCTLQDVSLPFPHRSFDGISIMGSHLEPLSEEGSETSISPHSTPDDMTSLSKENLKLDRKKISTSVKKNDRDKWFKTDQKTIEQASKDERFGASLRSYLDVCISCNMVSCAHSTLLYYLSRLRLSNRRLTAADVNLFNVIMTAAAQQGNLTCVQQLMSRLRSEGLKPNLQTYAACFSCVSRLSNLRKEFMLKLFEDITKDGLNLANLDKECSFTGDQRECVLKAIRLVLPNFKPDPFEVGGPYTCNLLSSLNESSSADRVYSPCGSSVHYGDLSIGASEQLSRELAGDATVESVERHPEPNEKRTSDRSELEAHQDLWQKILLESFNNRVRILGKQPPGHRSERTIMLHPYLIALDPSSYVNIMLQEITKLAESSENFSLPRSSLHSIIGFKVLTKYMVKRKQQKGIVEKIEMLMQKYCEYYVNPKLTSQYNPRHYWQKLCAEHHDGPTLDIWDIWWPNHIVNRVGKFLYDVLIQEVKINYVGADKSYVRSIPAFYNIYRNSGGKSLEEIKTHPALVKLFRTTARRNLTFPLGELPMLSPPLPWVSMRTGGYWLSSAKLIRESQSAAPQTRMLEKVPVSQPYPIYDSLNQLSECPWIVNKPVLDVIIEVFNGNGDSKLSISPPASACPPLPHISAEMSNVEKAKLYHVRNKLKQTRAEKHSLWCDTLYKLSIANHFRDKVFWFPHNLDFRGRVYPVPPHFNHLGNDATRSTLLFAKGEPLGDRGLDWLKIQIINLTGFMKRNTISERLRFANEMMDEILDSADRPLTGRKWWQNSDEPWQTLAGCMEVAKASRSPYPTKYVCHLPIHQDGSCNGLQHYAALGRDQQGAEQVNLCSLDTPQDVYSGVAEMVERLRKTDAANGVEIAQILEGYVKRKVIKQTVMTTVYGVTRFGSRLQIIRQLKDLTDFPQDKIFAAASYLSQKTFFSLQQMFTSAKEIQDWFTESARQISQVCGQPVEWVTPLGLPIVQPYQKTKKAAMAVGTGDKNAYLYCDIAQRPNVIKQRNAFPPNFIHSLDSTHMMLTSLYCQRAGITFVSVHDCFWTHPSTVHIMNKVCRQQFVALHCEPILENLSRFLFHKFSYGQKDLKNDGSVVDSMKRKVNKTLMRIPRKGNFQIENVLNSTYFFS